MMKSRIPCAEYVFMMCHRIGFPPISIMGFGRRFVSSEIRVPVPPARITAFILDLSECENCFIDGKMMISHEKTKSIDMISIAQLADYLCVEILHNFIFRKISSNDWPAFETCDIKATDKVFASQ